MIPDNLIFLQAVPDVLYFQWQIEVQITNFRKFGISDKMHILVWFRNTKEFFKWSEIKQKYPEVKIFMYKDEGVNIPLYIPQLRPHILKRHFEKYQEEFKNKVFFYHDSDIIFNYLPNFEKLIQGNVCWQSNTDSYIGFDYLRKKELKGNIPDFEAIDTLCKIGGISRNLMKSYSGKTGGAQYILKGIDSDFWKDVEEQVIAIRAKFYWGTLHNPNTGSINHRYFKNENEGFQSWCADMWAVNMALWKRNIKTDITSELDFSWAIESSEAFKKKPIFHNAGVTSTTPGGVFNKSEWKFVSPIDNDKLTYPSENTASFFYVDAIKQVK